MTPQEQGREQEAGITTTAEERKNTKHGGRQMGNRDGGDCLIKTKMEMQ